MLSFNFFPKFRKVLRKRRTWLIIVTISFCYYFYLNYFSPDIPEGSHSPASSALASRGAGGGSKTKKSNKILKSQQLQHWPAEQSPLKYLSCTTRMASFWIGDGLKDFLFKGFNVNAHEGLAFVCIGLASSAILFEGLRTLRDSFLHKFIDKQKANRAFENRKRLSQRLKIGTRQGGSPAPGTSHDYGGGGDTGDASISLMRTPLEEDDDYELSPKNGSSFGARFSDESEGQRKFKIFLNLILSTFLHMIYILLGYILMLSVMTFNVWLLVAIAIGIGIGQFIFGVYRRTDIVLSHHPETVITSRKSSSNFNEEEFSSPSTATLDTETNAGQGSARDNIPASQSTLDNHGVSGNQTHCLFSVSSGSENSHSSENQTAEIIVHSNLESTISPNASNVSSH